MRKLTKTFFLLCGLSFALAAFPVFGQQGEVEINRQPLKDFAKAVKAKRLDWTKPFSVEAEVVLTKEGKFDKEKTKFIKSEGDTALTEAVKQAFEAAGESGWFGYLNQLGAENIKLSVSQNTEVFSMLLISEHETLERSRTVASALNMMVKFVLMSDENGKKKLGDDEKKLLRNTKVTAEEKSVTINVSIPAADFQEMMRRRLDEKKEETAK